jgi:Protein of unknown function (DUF3192)
VLRISTNLIVAIVLLAGAFGAPSAAERLSLEDLASTNQASLVELSPGMSKADVLSIMGDHTAKTRDGIVNNPWIVETSVADDGTLYEALYYVIRKNQPFTPVRKSLTTAIVLKDGKVIGWGEGAFERYR